MKITKSQLKQLIKEELESTLTEAENCGPKPKVTAADLQAAKKGQITDAVQARRDWIKCRKGKEPARKGGHSKYVPLPNEPKEGSKEYHAEWDFLYKIVDAIKKFQPRTRGGLNYKKEVLSVFKGDSAFED